jgi:hypothetical protein
MRKLLFLLVLLTSCGTILKKIAGIKDPKVVNLNLIQEHLTRNDFITDDVLVANDTTSLDFIVKNLTNGGGGLQDVYIFDSNFNQINFKRPLKKSCPKQITDFLDSFDILMSSKTNINSDSNYKLVKKHTTLLLDNNKIKPNYYILFKDVLFVNNDYNLNHWSNAVKRIKKYNVKILYLNLDVQENWGIKASDFYEF